VISCDTVDSIATVCLTAGPGYGNMHPHSEGQMPTGQAQPMFMNMNVSSHVIYICL